MLICTITLTQLVTSILGIRGIERVPQRLIAGDIIPAGASVTYQWEKANTPDGTYIQVSGATDSIYYLTTTDYGKYFKVVATGTGNFSGAVISAYKGPIEPATISLAQIQGLTQPVLGATAATLISETNEYTGSIAWSPSLSADGKFQGNTEYSATITLAPKLGYTAAGLPADFFTIAGASTITNAANTAIISAKFPSTALTPITAMGSIQGSVQVDRTLTAGSLTPTGATASYQWQWSTTANGTYTNITGATSNTYALTTADYPRYIRVVATSYGAFSGVITSSPVGPVAPAVITISTIEGIPIPVKNVVPVYTITETSQFTGTVIWSPAPSSGTFRPNTAYTATITLTPKSGYTLTGVTANFFKVVGAITSTNLANSGQITATNPKTQSDPITAIDPIHGLPVVGETLTAGAITPSGATVNYQWWRSSTFDGTYSAITGATAATYVLTPADNGLYIRVSATGTGLYIGDLTSPYKGPIQPARISLYTLNGITPPVTGQTPVTSPTATAEYTLSVAWSPVMPNGVFEVRTIYRAEITVTPKTGYTLEGIPLDFFRAAGASFVTNSANSGSVIADFPATQ